MKQFSDHFKNSSARVSYVSRSGYNKLPLPTNVPFVSNLHLPMTCAIALPFDPSISQDQYLCAVGDIVGDDKIVFAGKNNDKVKVYLPTEADVLKFYEQHPQIVINGKVLSVSKLVNNGHKIFLCNTEPGMSDSLLIKELSKYTTVLSDMKFVSLGSRVSRFSHVIGFRRTVMVESVENLPASFNLFFENTNYKIFVVIDCVKCYNCNADGHLSKNCPLPKTSPQERLDKVRLSPPSTSSPGTQRLNNPEFTLLPPFASRIASTKVPPLHEMSVPPPSIPFTLPDVSIPPPTITSSVSTTSSPLTQVLASSEPGPVVSPLACPLSKHDIMDQDDVILSSQLNVSPPELSLLETDKTLYPTGPVTLPSAPVTDPITSVTDPTSSSNVSTNPVTDPTASMTDPPASVTDPISTVSDTTMIGDKSNMKRAHSQSPPRDCDKKSCVDAPTDLDCISPIITELYPDVNVVNPLPFVDLIRDLKGSKRKIEMIKEDYNMQPKFVVEVLTSVLLSDQLLDKSIKNRLKNLPAFCTKNVRSPVLNIKKKLSCIPNTC
ncbi:hypothetical protein WDU94_014129 [Cyamophila willieti]